MQKQSELEKKNGKGLEGLKEKFEQEKSHVVESAPEEHARYRVVRLIHYQECGCGLEDIAIERTVPYDSPYQNGDRVTELEEADEIVVD